MAHKYHPDKKELAQSLYIDIRTTAEKANGDIAEHIDYKVKLGQLNAQDAVAVKEGAKKLFAPSFPQVKRMMSAFDNTEIKTRNLCKPLEYYSTVHSRSVFRIALSSNF